jgi:hypothetical protein
MKLARGEDHVLTFIEPQRFLDWVDRLVYIVELADAWADAKQDPKATELIDSEEALFNAVLIYQEARKGTAK